MALLLAMSGNFPALFCILCFQSFGRLPLATCGEQYVTNGMFDNLSWSFLCLQGETAHKPSFEAL
jgi:hypothetical protein